MSLECLLSDILVLQLPKRPLIDNVRVPRIIEQAGRDPGLHAPRRVNIHIHTRKREKKSSCLLRARAIRRGSRRELSVNRKGSLD